MKMGRIVIGVKLILIIFFLPNKTTSIKIFAHVKQTKFIFVPLKPQQNMQDAL